MGVYLRIRVSCRPPRLSVTVALCEALTPFKDSEQRGLLPG